MNSRRSNDIGLKRMNANSVLSNLRSITLLLFLQLLGLSLSLTTLLNDHTTLRGFGDLL